MRISLAMLAGALLVAVPAQASAAGTTPRLPEKRLGQSIWHATLMGSFFDRTGKYHSVSGEGDFFPTFGPSSTEVRFSVQLTGTGGDAINFGTLLGDSVTPGGGSPDKARFDAFGVPNENGYQLNASGTFVSGHIDGSFEIVGNGGIGGGQFAGHP